MGRKRVKHDLETKRDKYVVNVSYSFYCYFTFSEASVGLGIYFPLYLEKISLGWMKGRRERGKEGRKKRKKERRKEINYIALLILISAQISERLIRNASSEYPV